MQMIGERINYYRKKRGLSRKDLGNGICNESTLFRIEKGNSLPSMFLLEQLCQKLKIPMSVLFDMQQVDQQKSIVNLKQQCRKHVYDKEYTKLSHSLRELQALQKKTGQQNDLDHLFIIWHEAIILDKKDNQPLLAKQLLEQSLSTEPVLEIEISMINTLGLICLSLEEEDEAVHYFRQAYKAIEHLPPLDDPTLFVRVGYNYASRLYYRIRIYKNSDFHKCN